MPRISRCPLAALFALSVLGATSALAAQQRPVPPSGKNVPPRTAAVREVVEAPAPQAAAISRLRWRSIGPTNQAGRVSVVAGVPGDPYTYYVAGANGGIIKTINAGQGYCLDDTNGGKFAYYVGGNPGALPAGAVASTVKTGNVCADFVFVA